MPDDAKTTAARAFVRSLNILLKFARLYSFDHVRTNQQFETAWGELRTAVPASGETGLLLGASGSQLLLDGAPLEATPAERSFAQLLSSAGLASIQFSPSITQDDLGRFVRAFPTSGVSKLTGLAAQLKTAIAGCAGIRVNEVRFVAEDESMSEMRTAAQLTAKALGGNVGQLKDLLNDPQKLLELIAAAEGSRGEPGRGTLFGNAGGGGVSGPGDALSGSGGTGSGLGGGTGNGPGGGSGTGGGAFSGGAQSNAVSAASGGLGTAREASAPVGGGGVAVAGWAVQDEEVLNIFRVLGHLGRNAANPSEPGVKLQLAQGVSQLSAPSRDLLRQALQSLAAKSQGAQPSKPALLRVAEHLAIRFALERYERGEVRVNAVREMLDKMNQEIEALRAILGSHEEKMAEAGLFVEAHTDLLDRQFWAAVPEHGKRTVLTSPEAWCIPPRNVKHYVDELRRRGDHKLAASILAMYSSCIQGEEAEARRRTAIGLVELAELYGEGDGDVLAVALRESGTQLSLEREADVQDLVSAAFVRLGQEAGAKRDYTALLQALDSLDNVENQRPSVTQALRPRIGIEKRLPEIIEDCIRNTPEPKNAVAVLRRMPRHAFESLIVRFNRSGHRKETRQLAELATEIGNDGVSLLRELLRTGTTAEATESIALLSRLDPEAIERWLPERLRDWPRVSQDRLVRLLSFGGAEQRGWLLACVLNYLEPILRPLAVDEAGMSGDQSCADALLRVASGEDATSGSAYLRLKAIEALGRLHVAAAAGLLEEVASSRRAWRWTHHAELRISALQSLWKINPPAAQALAGRSGLDHNDLTLPPLDPAPETNWFRQRRYPRVRLATPIVAVATADHEAHRLEVRGLSLSGGIAIGERHMHPGTLVTLKLGSGLRPIRAQVVMRDARAQGLGFEFAEMDLDERGRLRRLLLACLAPEAAALALQEHS
jgi:hypothetical protein